MDRVLGLSMTPHDIRWVLADGTTGEGATIDHGVLGIADAAEFDAEALLDALLDDHTVLHAVGYTYTPGATATLAKVRDALAVLGGGAPVVEVSDVEASEALAAGIAELTRHGLLAVCIAEPDAVVVATVDAPRVTTQRIERTGALIAGLNAAVGGMRPSPDAIFVLGSDDADALAGALREETTRPVITAEHARFALARGAALAAGRAIQLPDAPVTPPRVMLARVASAVLAAAAVVLVVAVSLVMVPHHTGSGVPASGPAAPVPAVAAPPAAPVAPPVYEPRVAASIYIEPIAPAVPAAPPRLRDRIKERIPGLNRLG